MPTPDQFAARSLRALIPPPRLRLSDWIEGHVCLPDGVSAQPGPVRLWPFQREIADAIGHFAPWRSHVAAYPVLTRGAVLARYCGEDKARQMPGYDLPVFD